MAALRGHGYRPDNRYLVFQVLEFTLGLPSPVWRVLTLCHERHGTLLNVSSWPWR